MKKVKLLDIITALTIIATFVVTIIFYFDLPQQIPSKFDMNGQVIEYGQKMTLFIVPALSLAMYSCFPFLAKIDPKGENYQKFQSSYDMIKYIIVFILAVLHFIILHKVVVPDSTWNISKLIMTIIGILFIVIGNKMPKLKQNFFVGIRTPWTLTNPEVWCKTHRLGGFAWVISGAVLIISQLFNINIVLTFIVVILLSVVVPIVYSCIAFKNLK